MTFLFFIFLPTVLWCAKGRSEVSTQLELESVLSRLNALVDSLHTLVDALDCSAHITTPQPCL